MTLRVNPTNARVNGCIPLVILNEDRLTKILNMLFLLTVVLL
jgi:hypothetical protein